MKKILKIAFALAAALASLTAGCTSLKINKDGSGNYRNGIFQKQFSGMQYSKDGDKVSLKIDGYVSDAAAVIQGLEIMKAAYTGQPVKP